MNRTTYDLIVHNGTAVTVNADFDIIDNALICVRDGAICELRAHLENDPLPEATETVNADGGLIMPGLVNTHTHLPMVLFRGLADDLPLAVWLNEHMFPAENKFLTPENVTWGTLLASLELLLSGTTTCCGGYFLEEEVARAVTRTGLRAILGQGVIDFPAPGVPDPSRNVACAAEYVDRWLDREPRIRPSIFCHSPYTCSAQTVAAAKAAADERGVLFQIHVAETKQEYTDSVKEHGVSPVGYLDRLGVLDENTLAVHTVWADEADIRILAKRGVRISHNIESNLKLAAGIAPVPVFLKAGLTVGLGTDGCASNNDLDLFGEMGSAARVHKATTLDPTVLDAQTVIRMATLDGARAIGLDAVTGSLETGKQADLIVLKTAAPHLTPLYSPASHIVYAMRGGDVSTVIIGGQILVQDRQPVHLDQDEIIHAVTAIARKIRGS